MSPEIAYNATISVPAGKTYTFEALYHKRGDTVLSSETSATNEFLGQQLLNWRRYNALFAGASVYYYHANGTEASTESRQLAPYIVASGETSAALYNLTRDKV